MAAPLKIRMDKKGTALQKVFGQLSGSNLQAVPFQYYLFKISFVSSTGSTIFPSL